MLLTASSPTFAAQTATMWGGNSGGMGQSLVLTLPGFDASLGELQSVTFHFSITVANTYSFTNNSLSGYYSSVQPSVSLQMTSPGDEWIGTAPGSTLPQIWVPAAEWRQEIVGYDRRYNWLGQLISSTPIIQSVFYPGTTEGTYLYQTFGTLDVPADFAPFSTQDSFTLEMPLQVVNYLSPSGGYMAPDYDQTSTLVNVSYTYLPVPEPTSAGLTVVSVVALLRRRRTATGY
ncbi:MAG: choice-of-anchor E domain-containing protein [Verrucomicrobiae bacterium]|nr:choice-of-anchor E domain-containing protein [Verrucomicrobiae bacterium]